MKTSRKEAEGSPGPGITPSPPLAYRLCPHCARAVPIASSELYCVNDGTWLLEACLQCGAPITSPYARFCTRCGTALTHPVVSSPPHG